MKRFLIAVLLITLCSQLAGCSKVNIQVTDAETGEEITAGKAGDWMNETGDKILSKMEDWTVGLFNHYVNGEEEPESIIPQEVKELTGQDIIDAVGKYGSQALEGAKEFAEEMIEGEGEEPSSEE